MNSTHRLNRYGWPLAWILWMLVSLCSAFLLFSGASWQWITFLVLQLFSSFLVLRWVQLQAWTLASLRASSDIPLWKAAGEAIHDVGTPLHVLRFCVQQMTEHPTVASTERFQEQLSRSSDRTLEAFDRLRLFTRSVRDEEGPVSFRVAYEQALRVVQSRFPDHPALKALKSAEAPEDLVYIGAGPLIRALSILIGRCLAAPGTISVSVEPRSEELLIAIAGETGGARGLDLETQSVRQQVKEWGGDLKRLFLPERKAYGYSLHLAREARG